MALDMLSGPTDFDIFIFFNSFSIPGAVMFSKGISNVLHFSKFGRVLSFLCVNTELNCSTKIWAFSLLSLKRFPFCFSGATPILSCFLAFMYLQNGLQLLLSKPS